MIGARVLIAAAGLMGTAGVVTAAAGAHGGGGDLAHIAAEFLLIHAAVVLSIALAIVMGLRPVRPWLIGAATLAAGTVMFGADLDVIAFAGSRPLPLAAPIGGSLMIIGWLMVTLASVLRGRP